MINSYIDELKENLSRLNHGKIESLVNRIRNVRDNNGKIYLIGNGGSAVTASHWACDLNKGTLSRFYDTSQKRLKVISLTDNIAVITALANDITYDEIFSQQLRNLIQSKDMLIIMTGSGKSRNVINAIDVAKKNGAFVFSLLGFDGGEVLNLSDESILVESNNYGVIEDIHLTIGHIVTSKLKLSN